MAKKRAKKKTKKLSRPKEAKEKKPFRRKETIRLPRTKIKIIGIGGGGNSIVAEIATELKRAYFVAANTDLQALKKIAKVGHIFPFGEALTHNLGTGMDPGLGELAAQKEKQRIEKLFQGVDLTILVSCLGGGTGSGSLPIFAEAAKKAGSDVLAILTLPFKFEGEKKAAIAERCLEKVEPFLQGQIIISNERIFRLVDKKTPLQGALSQINQILGQSLGSLIEVFYSPGFINIDFSDLKTTLKGKEKLAYLHSVTAGGAERAARASQLLFQNPLYEYTIKKPKRILFNIAGGKDLKISEVEKIARTIWEKNPRAKIIFGVSQRPGQDKEIKVTILALGSQEEPKAKKKKIRFLKTKKPTTVQGEESEEKPKEPEPEPEPKPEPEKEKDSVPQKIKIKKGRSAKAKAKTKKVLTGKKSGQPRRKKRKLPAPAPEAKKRTAALRRNALDLKKEAKKIEKELLAQESRWDVPAFLRRKRI